MIDHEAIRALNAEETRVRIAELDAAFWRDGYDRARELEAYALRGHLARIDREAPDVRSYMDAFARDARS